MVQDSTDIWFCGFLCGSPKITTIATSTTMATATAMMKRFFEAIRVTVTLFKGRGLYYSFCRGNEIS